MTWLGALVTSCSTSSGPATASVDAAADGTAGFDSTTGEDAEPDVTQEAAPVDAPAEALVDAAAPETAAPEASIDSAIAEAAAEAAVDASPEAAPDATADAGLDADSRHQLRPILAANPNAASGTYTITPDVDAGALPVTCDMTTSGGGWTLFGNVVSGGFDYASTITAALGTSASATNVLASKPAATVARMKITGATFAFDVVQSAAGAAYSPSTDATQPYLLFDTLLDQSGAAAITVWSTLDGRGWSFSTNGTGYNGSSIVFINGGSGSTIAGYAYTLPGTSGCAGVDDGLFWVLEQGAASGYVIINTMEMAEHYTCNNRTTGVMATQVQLFYR